MYGDQSSVLSVFDRGGARHGIFALVDFNHLGGWVKDLSVTDDPAALIRDLRKAQLESGGVARTELITAQRARRLVEDGIAATDMTIEPEVDEDYPELRAVALARCRVMPAEERAAVVEVSAAERERLVEEFLADGAGGIAASDSARYCARLLVDYGCNYDAGQPLRVGPGKLETFLFGFLARKVVLDQQDRAALPEVTRAWVGWAADRTGLPAAAVAALRDKLEEMLAAFDDAYDGGMSPMMRLLRDLPPDITAAQLQDIANRRLFAMPHFATTIGDEDFPELDPSDEDERRLLIIGEHPELHDDLDDPDFDADAAGFSPNLHIAVDEIVINQLWHGDPPEVWQTAQRLTAAGMERLDVIHEIANVAVRRVWHSMVDGQPFDAAAYTTELAAIQPPRSTQAAMRRTAAAVPPGSMYQLKVTLAGSRPPIWRRLAVPADATLDGLHQVIQSAFGWHDAHLHAFAIGGTRYAPRRFDLDGTRPSDNVSLSSVLGTPGSRCSYEYDFGDSWQHDIVVEKLTAGDPAHHAVCLAGRRSGPAEDCGGISGWEQLCTVLTDPSHPDHAEHLDWLGYLPEPEAFDQAQLNTRLAKISL